MELSTLEERLSDYGPGGYYLLETFILELLRLDAESQGQTIVTGDKSPHSRMDAFAPKGVGSIKQPLSIEIIHVLSPKRLDSIVNLFLRYKKTEDEGLLIISLRNMAKDSLTDSARSRIGKNLYIWEESDLQPLISRHRVEVDRLQKGLFSARIKMAVSRSHDEWKEKRDEVISDVAERYRLGRFSLLLGAGVSSSAGLPDWDTLLNSLFVSMLTNDELNEGRSDEEAVSSIVKRLRQLEAQSTLSLARYIRRGLSTGSKEEQAEFTQSVTKQLYSLRDKRFNLRSSLIREIAGLCVPTRTGANVRAILTYNFDDLMERELHERNLSYKSIFEEIDLANSDELPIYHVHGFLPEDRSLHPGLERATLVFSEEGYHRIYSEAYHWSNLIQLSNFKETSCLMIGLSLTDPNLRRLLEISAKSSEKPKHFAFLKRMSVENLTDVAEGKPAVRAPAGILKKICRPTPFAARRSDAGAWGKHNMVRISRRDTKFSEINRKPRWRTQVAESELSRPDPKWAASREP